MNKKTVQISVVITTIIVLIWLLSGLYIYQSFPEGKRGEIGDMFGAINALFAGIALIGIVVAIILQQKELELQRLELKNTREVFQKQKFENTFFNLLTNQNQILSDIIHDYTKGSEDFEKTDQLKGREFFKYIQEHLTMIYDYVKAELSGELTWNDLEDFEPIKQVFRNYGITQNSIKEFVNSRTEISEIEISMFCDKQIFAAFQYKYAHFFRHIYRILRLIRENEEEELLKADNESKRVDIKKRHRDYSKFVQSQMSTSEMFVMFYNSLKFEKMIELVNKYDFLENLQKELLLDISHERFYEFEFKSKEQYFKRN